MSARIVKNEAAVPAGYRARPRVSKRSVVGFGHLAFVLLFFGALELLVRLGGISRLVVSEPSKIFMRLWRDLWTNELWIALYVTALEVAGALAITLLVGLAIGYTLYTLPNVRRALEPGLVAFYSAPAILLYPVFMTLLGPGSAMIITMAVIMGTVPISVNLAIGFEGIDPILRKLGRSLGMTRGQLIFKILVPAATPVLFAGFRLGLTFALIAVIALEFLTYSGGLGRLISWRYFVFDTDGVYAAILLVSIIAIAVSSSLTRAERYLSQRWR